MKAAWALLLCGCGAAPGTWPEGTSAPRWSLDGPPRVEILVDGVPALFDVDPEVRGVRLAIQLLHLSMCGVVPSFALTAAN